MSRTPFFDSPFLLGFDQMERLLDRVTRSSHDGYPPYNIEKTNDREIRITLAVAGFDKESLDVSLEDGQLIIKGAKADDDDREFLHRGIAARHFQRTFILADGIEVQGAWFENGLLSIDCVRPDPEQVVRNIDIKSGRPVSAAARKRNGKSTDA